MARSIKPLGNLIIHSSSESDFNRNTSLGNLSSLPDEILLLIFAELPLPDLHRSQAVSQYFFAWSAGLDGLWKAGFISRNNQRLSDWKGTWRSTYISKFLIPPSKITNYLPTDSIQTRNVFSDVLFQPLLCVNHSVQSILNPLQRPKSKLNLNVSKLIIKHSETFTLPTKPTIFKELMDGWPAYDPRSEHLWTLDSLIKRYPDHEFRAESTLVTLADYRQYHDQCMLDESPIYLFDSEFVEKSAPKDLLGRGLGDDYSVPETFREDLFSCLGDHRPDYRWLIIGPARSGSTWHIDPNGTSAWNAVITGRKYWICFPPHVTPPGVLVSEDESEVESPLSISEWFLNYYQFAKETYGQSSKNPKTRQVMLEGICEAGETFFVPSGWWHLVINLEPSIAITQNFVSESNLSSVLHFMKYKPDQLSGFKCNNEYVDGQIEGNGASASDSIYERFVDQLKASKKISHPSLENHLEVVEQLERQRRQDQSERSHKDRSANGAESIMKKRKNPCVDGSVSIWDQLKKPHLNPDSQLARDGLNVCADNIPAPNPQPPTGGFKFDFEILESSDQ